MDLPDNETIIDLEPEELAGHLMAWLNDRHAKGVDRNGLIRHNALQDVFHARIETGIDRAQTLEALKNLGAAWSWCEREVFLAPQFGNIGGEVVFITKRGAAIKDQPSFSAWRVRSLLPRGVLHPKVSEVAWPDFLRGDYDSAIFKAFKAVEETVRDVGRFPPELIGTKLTRAAFGDGKPLSARTPIAAEANGEGDLFTGGIALFKNPGSHRTVGLKDVAAAVEAIMLASLLVRMAESRR